MGGMGRTTYSSILMILHPWSCHTAPGSITWHSLGGKSYFLAHKGTQSSRLPPTTWLLPPPWSSRESGTLCKQDHQQQKAQASRLGFPGSNTMELSSLKSRQEIGPGTPTACRLGSFKTSCQQEPLNWDSRSPCGKSGTRAPATQRLGTPRACNTSALPFWSPRQGSRPQKSCYLKVWSPRASSSCRGSG
jgi:hypothetical protein